MPSITNGSDGQLEVADRREVIAIIGMATRFPQEADNNDNLWKFLLQARNAMTPFPKERVNTAGHYHPDPEHGGTFHTQGAHFMKGDPADFDYQFFNITKSEVMAMDPQQRVLLENVYQALENAGIPLGEATSSMASVFVSGFNHDFLQVLNKDTEVSLKYMPTGMSDSILSNRVSWFYDFKAPSLTVDTACSSSLVAFHLGCQSLLNFESEMAIVSGVSVLLLPEAFHMMSTHGFLSPDGKCFSFDHRANGYSRGEGVGTIIIKRLSDAIRDGNTIRAIVRATGVNQDGRTPGITLPNSIAQEKLIRDTYAKAGLGTENTMFIESHGTGTAAGDPIEARAIARAFSPRDQKKPLYIGAMKSAIGHLEGTAGVASLIKSVMILESGVIPPNANFEKPNPKIPIDIWNIQFPLKPTVWPSAGLRRVSVNASGFGGTNAHAILDDAYHYLEARKLNGWHNSCQNAPSELSLSGVFTDLGVTCQDTVEIATSQKGELENGYASSGDYVKEGDHTNGVCSNGAHQNGDAIQQTTAQPTIFVWSAFDEGGILRNARSYAQYFKALPPLSFSAEKEYLADLAYTLSSKRSQFAWRSFCVASSLKELIGILDDGCTLSKPVRARGSPKICFVFTGQGAQWYAMGRELLIYSVFRRSLEEASTYLKTLGSPWSLLDELLRGEADSKINHPSLAHPACAALQIALVELLASWHILPSRVVGHSSGEIAAAYCAGKLGREAAWKVAYFRGVVSAKRLGGRGAMIAVALSEDALAPYMARIHVVTSGEMMIACYNSPKNHTVAGDETKIDALKALLDADSVFVRKLNVANAYHTSLMKPASNEYLKLLENIQTDDKLLTSHEIHMFSSVTGQLVQQPALEAPQYWIDNMISPVSFTKALLAACFQSLELGQKSLRLDASAESAWVDEIVEIGPHSALQSAIKETTSSHGYESSIRYSSVLSRSDPEASKILKTVASLQCRGLPIDIGAANGGSSTKPLQMLVKLPPYSFDHSDKIWYESRMSKNFRLREHPRHDLFGARVLDWDAEEPRWRHIVRISENPWLRDHIVTGLCIYPGTGYIVMAIEAAKQISDPRLITTGYRLQDVTIRTALKVPDTKEGVEVTISMSRKDESSSESSLIWSKFRISSYNPVEDDWLVHCTGYIAVDYDTKTGPVDNGQEAEADARAWKDALLDVSRCCRSPVDMKGVYENWHDVGISLGPVFNNLSNVKLEKGHGKVKGLITVPSVASIMPKNYMHAHVIHPCTLDSMLQLFLTSIPDCAGLTMLETAILPTFLREVWISAATSSDAGHTFRGYGKSRAVASQKFESDIMVWDGDIDEARVLISGVTGIPVSNVGAAELQLRKLCHHVEWKPDLDLFQSVSIPNATLSSHEELEDRRKTMQDLQLASMLLITDALEELKHITVESLEGHFRKYFEWMLHQASILKSDSMPLLPLARWEAYSNNEELKEKLHREVAESGPNGVLCVRMGSNITRVLKKEVDPLYLMFGMDDLLDKVYGGIVGTGDLDALTRAYLELVGHSLTDLNVLEVGAGTGASSVAVLETLSPRSADEQSSGKASMIATYTFTDISSGFFEKAKDKFKRWGNIMNFKTLNIEKDVVAQGFQQGEYDIIVAGNVLHATLDLKKTLANVRYLLKPGGKLIMQEGIRQDILVLAIAFGQLAGWWLGIEPTRKWGAWITEEDWDKALRETGFSGIDTSLKDSRLPELHIISTLVSSAIVNQTSQNQSQAPKKIIVITSDLQEPPDGVALSLIERISKDFGVRDCSLLKYTSLKDTNLTDTLCISLLELERSVLVDPSEDEYINIRHLLATCDGLLWVTGDTRANPEYGMITGLLRTVRWERDVDGVNMVTLAIANALLSQGPTLQAIIDLFKHQFIDAKERNANAEYLLQDGIFFTNRLVDSTEVNDYLNSKFLTPAAQALPLGKVQAERPLKLTTSAPGMLNKLEFVTDSVWYEPLGEHEVEIEIKAVGLNFRDIMIAMGEHNAMSFGSEGAGLVTRVGSAVLNVEVGDRVLYMDGMGRTGTFQTYGRVVGDLVAKISHEISFEAAAALPSVYVTAIYGLYKLAGLSKGETVLIHGAAGGVGQAAITLANLVGAEVFATVSTLEKEELIVNKYGVRKDHIFSSRDYSFAKGIMRMTENRGVDVILNSLSGEFLRRSWDCIAPFGRFIEIGKKDATNNGRISLNPFLRNVMMASVELPTMMRYRPKQGVELLEETVRLYSEGKIREAWPTKVLNYSQLEESFRALQSGRGMGKTVLVPKDEDIVPIVPEAPTPYRFQTDASYVLAGGLGGIGRSIAKWMSSRGAKSLIFLSRSGGASSAAADAVEELQSLGVTVRTFLCDVSDESLLASVVEECKATLPPIKGCIQGSMVLSDVMFENMPYEDFRSATRPKVQGSWNLHKLLPTDMDFFILLSSITGVSGSRSQANYSAGNTYQDALAAHRVSQGLPAVSLDLGPIFSLGYIAENSERLGRVKHVASQLGSVREDDVHSMIEYHLISTRPKAYSQVASGLTTASQFLAHGVPLPMWIHTPLFTQLASTSSATSGPAGHDSDSTLLLSLLGSVTSIANAVTIIADAIRVKLSKLLNLDVENIDLGRSVSSNGVDSLVAIELRTWLAKVLAADVPMLDILGTMPIGAAGLAAKVASVSQLLGSNLKEGAGVEDGSTKDK